MASSPCKNNQEILGEPSMSRDHDEASPPRHQDLPDEIIEDIFVHMPSKSVLRCRCLYRAWAATLSSAAFVDRHFDLANRRREVPRLCFLPRSAAASTVYAWSPELGKDVFTQLMAVPHNNRNGKLHAVTRTCRGVLLLRATDARIPLQPVHGADHRAP
ncbi:F-box/kelch-repeat protein At3g06240-like [Miscanthus floridulus]|uniref:F-box/kelch-repeat protein At3g06240-like n=1 Tax=Miscanthus floridulus TaxID=154761 RepID=UPI0034596B70